jgi:2-amino-4-hydroxy-6-hydroxymethyldihydropteridine diphosphokinase
LSRVVIFIALGANLPSVRAGAPRATLEAALDAMHEAGIRIVRRSRWYASKPVPASDQPDYVNGVVAVETALAPADLLARLHGIERAFGRARGTRNEARALDLDLIAYDDRVSDGTDGGPILPHPRLALRAFVLLPLRDIASDWRHPKTGAALASLIADLAPSSTATPLS